MSNWTRDFIFGVLGGRVSDEEWQAHVAANQPKPRPVRLRIRYDELRPVPRQVCDGLLAALVAVTQHRRSAASPLPPLDDGWWQAIKEQARWERG
jgi:hypothetical protein